MGYIYKKRDDREIFTDKYTGVQLVFNNDFLEILDEMNDDNQIHYSKYDVLKMFKKSPKLFKQVSNIILFSTFNRTRNPNATGYFDPLSKTITILPNAFRIPSWVPTNLNVTLYHEMAHALDHKRAKKGQKYESSSNDSEYLKYVLIDDEYQQENYGEIVHVSKHVKENGIHEDFAESMAMTALLLDGKNKSAIVRLSNGEKCTLEDWKNRFPNRYVYCKSILENNSLKSLIKYYINQVFENAFG